MIRFHSRNSSARARTTCVLASILALAAFVGMANFFASQPAQAELTAPSPNDRQITLVVTQLCKRAHLSRHDMDDELARRWLTNFLESIDPMKSYLMQSDVDEFRRRETELDDMALKGDINFAYTVFNRYLERVQQRVDLALEMIDTQHDFTVDEFMVTDADLLPYAKNEADARERWRKRIKYELLLQKADDKTPAEAVEKLKRRYRSFGSRMNQTSSDELLEMYLTAMTTALDPHTTYMSPETLNNFEIQMRLELDGIGASLRYEDGYTIVTEIVPGGAADKAGDLKPEDRVIGVGQGDDGEIEDVVEMKLSDVVAKIRGKRGTKVRLQVIPKGKTERVVYSITRDKIELHGSEARGEVVEVGQKPDGKPFKVGVINLPSFYMDMAAAQRGEANYKSTTRDVLKLLEDAETGFKAQGVDVVVMDLRQNGGGSLTEAISLTGLFIDEGPVVQVKGFNGDIEQHDDTDQGTAWDGPLVVLTSKLSASASEIFAGAIQDYRRGLIVGDHATHGKGTVQSLLDLGRQLFRGQNTPKLGALKITMQQFYRPNGDSTQARGVVADVELPSVIDHMDIGEANLDFALDFDRVSEAEYSKLRLVNEAMLKQLRERSQKRIQGSDKFQKVQRSIDRYLARKDRKQVTLNEAKFMAERKENEQDEEEEEEKPNRFERPVIKKDHYFDEAMSITIDYLQFVGAK